MAGKARSADFAKGGRGAKRGRTVDAAAQEVESKARAAGVSGAQHRSGPGAAARRTTRDQAILAGHHLGRSTAELARLWGVTQRTVQTVVKDAAKRRSALDSVPMDVVQRALADYESEVEIWSAIAAASTDAGNFNAAVAAMKGRADAQERWLAALGQLGFLPDNLSLFRPPSEFQRLGSLVLKVLKRVESGELTPTEGRRLAHDLVDQPQLPPVEGVAHRLA